MHAQTFRGENVQQALSAVRAALGPNAIIESTRHIEGTRSGFAGRNLVEIKAKAPVESARWPFEQPAPSDDRHGHTMRAAPRALRPQTTDRQTPTLGLDTSHLERELELLRTMLEELNGARPARDRALSLLHSAGIEGKLAKELAQGVARTSKRGKDSLRSLLVARIGERLSFTQPLLRRPGKKLIACVGQTGVGKTTTLAKLAARARLDLGQSAAVVTLDTFRVGAVEQWQRYAALMGLPLHVVDDVEAFALAVQASNAETIFVDTTGRSNAPGPWLLPECLKTVQNREIHVELVLPAWLRAGDVERVADQYADPPLTGLVVTKLDETGSAGGVLHAAVGKRLPLTYLCNGPCVPEDIREATLDSFIEHVLPSHP
ncbi:MAG TPA: flagellar biosynthesis protein FlhF [Polyangiaceae bacterium]|nr:flagellar biosynthesis protein FlhF [Polyangiaceae bacterium]